MTNSMMPKGRLAYRWLYLSRLASGQSADSVAAILRVSRKRNVELGLGGVLVFDGERFVQLLEGPKPVVRDLASRIAVDARHTDLRVLYEGESAVMTGCADWRAGYADGAMLDGLGLTDDDAPSEVALHRFVAMLTNCDLA